MVEAVETAEVAEVVAGHRVAFALGLPQVLRCDMGVAVAYA